MTTSSIVDKSPEPDNGARTPSTTPPKLRSKADSLVIDSTPISGKFASKDQNTLEQENLNIRVKQMADEITGKIVGPMLARPFLDEYLKTNVILNPSDLDRFRTEIQSLAPITKEDTMYPIFIRSIQPLCPLFQFRDTHSTVMKVFNKITIRPDVCAYMDDTNLRLNDPTRPDIMIEFKVDPGDDPFFDEKGPRKALLRTTDKARESLGQITTYAAAQQSAQFRTHVFSMLILPTYFRMLRWDRSGMIVTEKIKLTDPLLPEFFLRFSHATPEQQGVDVTVTKPSDEDASAARKALKLPSRANLVQFLVSPNKGGYIVARKTYMGSSKSPLGRSTRSFRAYSIQDRDIVFLKEAWRYTSQEPEHKLYAKLHEKQVPHIATVIDGADIGDHVTHTQDLVIDEHSRSWIIDKPKRLRKHIHYRLVLKEVASPLTAFSSTKHLVQVMRQAIIAHQKAYDRTSILHRDISVNNVMIYNGEALLIDWDLSKSEDEDPAPREIERTGTWQFIAARLLRKVVTPPGPHNLTDDLESFVHLLTWMAFVHTASSLATSDPASVARFVKETYEESHLHPSGDYYGGEHKVTHLLTGNKLYDAGLSSRNLFLLLTTLTERFAVRYARDPSQSSFWETKPPDEIAKKDEVIDAHKAKLSSISNSQWMITVFDQYLNAPNWRENDGAVDNKLGVEPPETSTDPPSRNSLRRSRESTHEESRKRMKTSMSQSGNLQIVVESDSH